MNRTITPSELQSLLSQGAAVALLDVRRAAARSENPVAIPGATWYDPETMERWIGRIDTAREIVLYCVHGESISNAVVDALHDRGIDARFIQGGLDAWQAAGGAVESTRVES